MPTAQLDRQPRTSEAQISEESIEWEEACTQLLHCENKIILFDVDQTLFQGNKAERENGGVLRPGVHELFAQLQANGNSVVLWSALGGLRAQWMTSVHHLDSYVENRTFNKPPMMVGGEEVEMFSQEEAQQMLGFIPDVVVDDDPKHAVEGVAFVNVVPYDPSVEGAEEALQPV